MTQKQEAQGKGRPTPSRKDARARNARPLIGDHSKEARKEARQQIALERTKMREGMASGDERYLMPRDKGPQRRYVRDYVDARLSVAEFLMPLVLVSTIITFTPLETHSYTAFILLWAFLFIAIIDGFIFSFFMKRKMRAKFKGELEKGLIWYAITRAFQMRFMRMPKPQVKRFKSPS